MNRQVSKMLHGTSATPPRLRPCRNGQVGSLLCMSGASQGLLRLYADTVSEGASCPERWKYLAPRQAIPPSLAGAIHFLDDGAPAAPGWEPGSRGPSSPQPCVGARGLGSAAKSGLAVARLSTGGPPGFAAGGARGVGAAAVVGRCVGHGVVPSVGVGRASGGASRGPALGTMCERDWTYTRQWPRTGVKGACPPLSPRAPLICSVCARDLYEAVSLPDGWGFPAHPARSVAAQG